MELPDKTAGFFLPINPFFAILEQMKCWSRFLIVLSTISFFYSCSSEKKKTALTDSSSNTLDLTNVKDIKNLNREEKNAYESWDVPFGISFSNGKIDFSSNAIFVASCSRSLSANCPDTTCEWKPPNSSIMLDGFQKIKHLSKENKNYVLLKGLSDGCGGSAYRLYILSEDLKPLCQLQENLSWEEEKKSECLDQVYKNPENFLIWENDQSCKFKTCS